MTKRSVVSSPFSASAFIILIILFFVCPAYAAEDHSGRIIDLKGEVLVMSGDGAWENASPGRLLFEGDSLRTSQSGWASILMSDETMIQISRNSLFVIKNVARRAGWFDQGKNSSGPSNSSEYRLDSGRAWMRNKNKNVPIDIGTPSVTAAIRGTELNIDVSGENTTTVTVLSGRVGMRNEAGSVVAHKSQAVEVQKGEVPRVKAMLSPEDSVQWTVTIPLVSGPMDMPLTGMSHFMLKKEEERLEDESSGDGFRNEHKIILGEIKRDLGKAKEAEKLFKECVSEHFDEENAAINKRAMRGLGWAYLDMKRPGDAESAFLRADPSDKMVMLGLSETFSSKGLYDKAMETNKNGAAHFPDSPDFSLQKAFFEIKSREIMDAEVTLNNLTRRFPDYSMGWSALSLVKLYRGDKTSSLACSEKAVSLKPASPTPYIIKGYSHQADFDLESAKKATEQALLIEPANTTALVNLAKILFGSDHTEEALEKIARAEDSDPQNAEVHSTKGFILLSLRKTNEAEECFDKAILSDHCLGEAYLGNALALMRQGQTESALEYISSAMALEPRRSLFASYWGKMLYEIKRFDRALEVLELASSLDPRDPTPELYKAIILNDLNRPTEAVEAVNRSMELNDNKAVYNSRFILDRDLAVKSVALSYLYNRLGLSDWGTSKALASIKQDFTNYSAHFFYGNGVFRDGDMSRVFSSETLLGKLLQPANINSYNSFNNYTSFFEKPGADITLSGSAGSHDTYSGSAFISGSVPSAGTAFGASAGRQITEGWKKTNNSESNSVSVITKLDPSPRDGIMLYASGIEGKKKDSMTSYSYSEPSDPYDRDRYTYKNLEAGYHRHLGPGTDFLLYFNKTINDGRSRYHSSFPPFDIDNPNPPPDYFSVTRHTLGYDKNDIPATQVQGQILSSAGNHQIMAGGLGWKHDWSLSSEYADYYLIFDEVAYAKEGGQDLKTESSFSSIYARDIWTPFKGFVVDAAVYLDVMNHESSYTKAKTELSELNPRLGIIWNPYPAHTFRLAGFRYLLPWFLNRIDPLEVAGIPMFRNADPGSITQEADFAYEYEWKSGFAGMNVFTINKTTKYKGLDSDGIKRSHEDRGDSRGFRLSLNQLVGKGIGFGSFYSYAETADDNKPSADRRDHRLTAKLTGVHESGLFGSLSQTFRYLDRMAEGINDEDIWLTDAEIGIELKDKKGVIKLQVLNIFDNHFDWITDLYVSAGRVPVTQYILSTTVNL